jgi:hypothetical protein
MYYKNQAQKGYVLNKYARSFGKWIEYSGNSKSSAGIVLEESGRFQENPASSFVNL